MTMDLDAAGPICGVWVRAPAGWRLATSTEIATADALDIPVHWVGMPDDWQEAARGGPEAWAVFHKKPTDED